MSNGGAAILLASMLSPIMRENVFRANPTSMRITTIFSFTLACLAAPVAWSACVPIKVAYVDQHRPPYYIGNGGMEASPPGASVELMNEIAASAGCTITFSRLPMMRLRNALEANLVDAVPMGTQDKDAERFAFPLDKSGKLDTSRAMRIVTVLFVRAGDKLPTDADPAQLMQGKRVGVVHGSAIAQRLRDAGVVVDDGASTTPRNLEKLRLGRIDVFAVAVISPTDMDAIVAPRFGKDIVRIDKPAQTAHLWVAFNKPYYEKNREQVETMWKWIGANGNARFAALVRKYEKFQ